MKKATKQNRKDVAKRHKEKIAFKDEGIEFLQQEKKRTEKIFKDGLSLLTTKQTSKRAEAVTDI